ncbi:retinal-specific phospholipid-transporting ATPase ABCA4-like [Nilaparvata lugens]|uniref:retinal-specific phospholipid-transporting ATPase ABCA4-like n=1 Tax=Nilaparvata lugens TaxID=108931 RepID=UPI00193DCE0D|nr:retinal-specific phospholipid-transporting ATPase ABCA4-like [Nilaparvata lugens]
MSYFLQLKMLIWKNLLIRKRQKFRCIVEVIWPLFLFLILMWVRTKDLREDIHECHFVQKAMPTAGGLPFLQSFFCTANNTCYKYQNDSEISRESMSSSLLVNLINSFQKFTEQGGQSQMQNLILDSRQMTQIAAKLAASQGELKLGPLIRNRTAFKEDLDERNVSLSQSAIDSLLSSRLAFHSLSPDQLTLLRENASVILCDETLMQDVIVEQQQNNGNSSALYGELCELSTDEAQNFVAAVIRHSNSATLAQQVFTFKYLFKVKASNKTTCNFLNHLSLIFTSRASGRDAPCSSPCSVVSSMYRQGRVRILALWNSGLQGVLGGFPSIILTTRFCALNTLTIPVDEPQKIKPYVSRG